MSSRCLSWLKTNTKALLWAVPAPAGPQQSNITNLGGFIVETPWHCCQGMASTGMPQRTVTTSPQPCHCMRQRDKGTASGLGTQMG